MTEPGLSPSELANGQLKAMLENGVSTIEVNFTGGFDLDAHYFGEPVSGFGTTLEDAVADMYTKVVGIAADRRAAAQKILDARTFPELTGDQDV